MKTRLLGQRSWGRTTHLQRGIGSAVTLAWSNLIQPKTLQQVKGRMFFINPSCTKSLRCQRLWLRATLWSRSHLLQTFNQTFTQRKHHCQNCSVGWTFIIYLFLHFHGGLFFIIRLVIIRAENRMINWIKRNYPLEILPNQGFLITGCLWTLALLFFSGTFIQTQMTGGQILLLLLFFFGF